MNGYYTNWNAGITKNGKDKTFSFKFDRKSTVARANVEKMIDDALSSGRFNEIDELYVKIINGTCRHVGHSGPKGFPSKKDRCAVKKTIIDEVATGKQVQAWKQQGSAPRSKPNPVKKTVYYCKRRKPQPLTDVPAIYNDPHKKEITQFTTACNDGFLNGHCPFAILLNLNNADDKAIIPEWLVKRPKVRWLSKAEGTVTWELNVMSSGEMPEEYTSKYVTKGVPKRGAKGDVVLVGMENLQPENAVTMGSFTKMYNHVSRKGPLPIFNVVHNNFGIPLTFKNFNVKSCSVLGISKLQSASKNQDNKENENDEYVNPSLIENFDRRWDDVVITGKELNRRTLGN